MCSYLRSPLPSAPVQLGVKFRQSSCLSRTSDPVIFPLLGVVMADAQRRIHTYTVMFPSLSSIRIIMPNLPAIPPHVIRAGGIVPRHMPAYIISQRLHGTCLPCVARSARSARTAGAGRHVSSASVLRSPRHGPTTVTAAAGMMIGLRQAPCSQYAQPDRLSEQLSDASETAIRALW